MKYNNIILIGMPGSGKSILGKELAKKLKFHFLDVDDYVEQKEGIPLQQIIDEQGDKGFREIEEKRILELNLEHYVISPGGSVIYSKRAMQHLKEEGIIVHLKISYSQLEKRLKNAATRGIVGFKDKTIKELYKEREQLYKQYADKIININNKNIKNSLKEILNFIKELVHQQPDSAQPT